MDYKKQFDETMSLFENSLLKLSSSWNFVSPLDDSVRYSLFSGGKRIRPVIMLETYKMFRPVDESALRFAAAIEALHTYSLVHDDLPCMDNDDFRRGKPTVHKKFGENIAVLTGDALLNLAYELVFDALSLSPNIDGAIKAGQAFAALTGARGLIAGQIADLSFPVNNPEFNNLEFVFRHKTCDLIIAAVKCGALAAGANGETVSALEEYAYNFGFAFQLADDLLDGAEDEGCSALRLYEENKVRRMLSDYTQKAVSVLDKIDYDAGFLKYLAQISEKRLK